MDPTELVAAARTLAADSDRNLGASRLIAACLLLRQALEAALDLFWQHELPAIAQIGGRRAQLITLPFYCDPDIARAATYTWNRLSAICHHHAYELPPTPAELNELLAATERLAALSTGAHAAIDEPVGTKG